VSTEIIVKNVMTENPLTLGPDAPLREAVNLMRERKIRHLPVVEDGGRLVGMLTDRDVRHAALVPALAQHLPWELRRLKSLRIRDVMTWSVVTTRPEATLAQAGVTMFQRRIGSLPVVDDGRLVGILTETDVLSALTQGQETDPDALVW
jgi:acetoin utilization protein AcuB